MLYGDHFQERTTEGDIRVALDEAGSLLPGEFYPLAVHFVAFLLETRGVDQLRALCDLGAGDAQEFEQAGMASIYFSQDTSHYYVGAPGGILSISPYPAGVYVVRIRVNEPTGPVDLHVSVKPWP